MVFHFELMDLDSLQEGQEITPLMFKEWKLSELRDVICRWQKYKREEGFWNAYVCDPLKCELIPESFLFLYLVCSQRTMITLEQFRVSEMIQKNGVRYRPRCSEYFSSRRVARSSCIKAKNSASKIFLDHGGLRNIKMWLVRISGISMSSFPLCFLSLSNGLISQLTFVPT